MSQVILSPHILKPVRRADGPGVFRTGCSSMGRFQTSIWRRGIFTMLSPPPLTAMPATVWARSADSSPSGFP